MNIVVSKLQPLEHYTWGTTCHAWTLVANETLSIKQERMPTGAAESMHYHQLAQQFFYILKGTATFEVEATFVQVRAGEGLHIKAGEKHCLLNREKEDLEFIVCSQPATSNDRINCAP